MLSTTFLHISKKKHEQLKFEFINYLLEVTF